MIAFALENPLSQFAEHIKISKSVFIILTPLAGLKI
jgi:hypothetical protein